jgi:hypothetical protein
MKTMKWVVAALITVPLTTRADIISNPVADGTIVVDTSRSDWAGLTAYTADPVDAASGDVDFDTHFMAHDNTYLFIRYTTHGGPGFASAWRYSIYLDIDQDRSTGYIGGGGQFSIGADVLIQGASMYSFAGANQTTFSWNFVGSGSFNEQSNDYELSFALSSIPGLGIQFDWIALGDNFPNTDDYVPDGGNGGPAGTFHTYVIPEPGTALLFAVGLGVLSLFRRARCV